MSLKRLSRQTFSEMNLDRGNLGIKNANVSSDLGMVSFLNLPGYGIRGISWRDDGTQFYVVSNAGIIRLYTVTTPWSIKGATLSQTASGFPTYVEDIYVSPTGQYLYLGGSNTLLQYQLNTPWSISSTTLITTITTTQLAIPEIDSIPSFTFSYDGTRLFIASRVGSRILAGLELSTPFMISTAKSSGLYIPSNPSGISFDSTGTRMLTLDASSASVSQYTLSVPWKPGSATLVNTISIPNIFGRETSPRSLYFKEDGTAFFIAGAATSSIYKFDLSIPWHVHSYYANSRNPLQAPRNRDITGLGISSNGAFLYYSNISSIFQTQLSTPNNLGQTATATSNTNFFTFIADSPYVNDFQLSKDGTKLYVSDAAQRIRQFNLSTPYMVNTASGPVATSIGVGASFHLEQTTQSNVYTFGVTDFDRGRFFGIVAHPYISALEMSSPGTMSTLVPYPGYGRNPNYAAFGDMYMRPDGLKTYFAAYRTTYRDQSYLVEYDNLIPYNISSMQFVSQIGLSTGWPSSAMSSLYISPDGGNLYFTGTTSRRIYQYALTTPWSLATATSRNMIMNPGDIDPAALQFSPDGSNLYVMCRGVGQIRQFPLNESWNILSNTTVFTRNYTKVFNTQWGGYDQLDFSEAKNFDVGDGSNAILSYSAIQADSGRFGPGYILNVRFDNAWQIATANVSTQRTIGTINSFIRVRNRFYAGIDADIHDFFRTVEQGKRVITGVPIGGYTPVQLLVQKLANTYDITSRMSYLKLDTRDTTCTGVVLDPSGMNLYFSNSVAIQKIALNKPFDIFSANLYPRFELVFNTPGVWDLTARPSQSLTTSTLEDQVKGFQFSANGQYLYITGSRTRGVDRYTLSTMWDLSTATLDTKILSTRNLEDIPEALSFKTDGTYMYVGGSANNNVQEYLLTTEWEPSTAVRQRSFNFGSTLNYLSGITFRDNGGSMFVSSLNGIIYDFTLGEEWNTATAQYLNRSYAVGADRPARDLFIPSSGNTMFIVDNFNDVVTKLPLNEAWNVRTVVTTSGTDKISLSGFDSAPSGVSLSSSGRKILLSGDATKTLRTLTINSATDISTAQLTNEIKSFPEVTISSLTGVTLSKDERSIYVADGGVGKLYQYDILYSPTRKP